MGNDPLWQALANTEELYRAEPRTGPMRITLHYHNGLRKVAVIETERKVGPTTRIVVEEYRIEYRDDTDRAIESMKAHP